MVSNFKFLNSGLSVVLLPWNFKTMQTYQVLRLQRDSHASGLSLTLTRLATSFSRLRTRQGENLTIGGKSGK